MKPKYARAEFARALDSLHAAKVLHAEGLLEDAVSRAYYAVMHSARAALLANDVIAESHTALRRLFGSALVQPGRIERQWAEVLAREQRERIAADYSAEAGVDEEGCRKLIEDADRFVQRMRQYLVHLKVLEDRESNDG